MENARQLSLFDDPSFFESIDVEFKSGRGGLPGSLWETYSAFANTNGGTIYIGIAEKDEALDVHGIKNASKMVDDLWSSLNNKGKVSENLLSSKDIHIVAVEGGDDVIRVSVPRANRSQRPV